MTQPHQIVLFRVRVINMPPSRFDSIREVDIGIQAGDTVLSGAREPNGSVLFTGELHVKNDSRKEPPVFVGPYTFGPPSARHLYLSWSGIHQERRQMFRRMKLPLGAIAWKHLIEIQHSLDAFLAAEVAGTARDGTPACATVPLLGVGWHVARRSTDDESDVPPPAA